MPDPEVLAATQAAVMRRLRDKGLFDDEDLRLIAEDIKRLLTGRQEKAKADYEAARKKSHVPRSPAGRLLVSAGGVRG